MKYQNLYGTDIKVSKICLGSMTWGEQNTEAEAHEQINYALNHGVNFIDTAELYPVPPMQETYGRTEEYIGSWLKKNGKRKDLIIASKVCGPERGLSYIRGGTRLTRKHIREAVENSLKRLQTDYIDLYQTHWPERKVMKFGEVSYKASTEPPDATIEDILKTMEELIREGKIRHVGVSNETPWGVMKHVNLAAEKRLPRIASIQNVYSLVNRTFEFGGAETAEREQVGLLAYSPLAFGVLSGKYLGGKRPEGARLTLFKRFQRYSTAPVEDAVRKYKKIAEKNNMSVTQMALAYVNTRSFVLSNIIGATNVEQLAENISSIDINLSEEMIEEINKVHNNRHNPSP